MQLCKATTDVQEYRFMHQGVNFVIVDTPGFDDTNVSDTEVMQKIIRWLTQSYQEGRKLNGVLYLHRITDTRMQGTASRNFRIFRSLCGDDFYSHVILGTSFWSTLCLVNDGMAVGRRRIHELIETPDFWGSMVRRGSRVTKIPETQEEARDILLIFSTLEGAVLQVQHETVNCGVDLSQTSAAIVAGDVEDERRSHELALKETEKLHLAQLKMVESNRQARAKQLQKEEKKRCKEVERERERLLLAEMKLEEERVRKEEIARQELENLLHHQRCLERETTRLMKEAEIQAAEMTRETIKGTIEKLVMKLAAGVVAGSVRCKIDNSLATRAFCDWCGTGLSGTGHYSKSVHRTPRLF